MSGRKEVSTVEALSVVNSFPMVVNDNNSVMEAMKTNLENDEITIRDMFSAIPNPKGEEEWSIDTPAGKKSFETLEAIILHIGNERAYYEEEYGVGETAPPDCMSSDGVTGVGEPGGKCFDCELSKFGPNSEAPKCSQKKPMYLLVPEVNPVMPVVINITGPSFPALKKFNIGLMQFGVNLFDIKVKLSLKSGKTKNNRPSSVIQFKQIANHKMDDPEGYEKLVAYRKSLLKFINPGYRKIQEALDEG